MSTFKEQEAKQVSQIVNLQHQLEELNEENTRVRDQMTREYNEMESTLQRKLEENQGLATEKFKTMKKAHEKQQMDIELVMEMNEKLKTIISTNKTRT